MPSKIVMPQLGESVIEGTLSKWLVSEGDIVNQSDPIIEVTTDKVDTEITAGASGTVLKLVVQEGTTVNAGALLGWIGEPGEALPDPEEIAAESESEESAETTSAPESSLPSVAANESGFVSPVVARIVTEHNLDLNIIQGTGRDGRVTKKDVLQYIEHRSDGTDQDDNVKTISSAEDQVELPEMPVESKVQDDSMTGDEIKLTSMRQSIAAHMVMSKHTAAHVTTVFEADMSSVISHRQAHKGDFAHDSVNLTLTAYFVTASAAALTDYPMVNSSMQDDKIILRHGINVGIAVSLGQNGLIVPVIRDAKDKSLFNIASELNDLTTRAREQRLEADEVQGGTFTITNHGVSGSLMATPIINQPQCAIMGVGVIQKRAVVIEDSVVVRPMAYLTLSFDHRIIDGVIADDFLANVKRIIEAWT